MDGWIGENERKRFHAAPNRLVSTKRVTRTVHTTGSRNEWRHGSAFFMRNRTARNQFSRNGKYSQTHERKGAALHSQSTAATEII